MPTFRRTLSAIVLTAGLATSGCTLCKPVVGAITGPVVILGNSGGDFSGCGCDGGYGVVAVLGVLAGVGAVGGLVTGIISDVQALCGEATDPCRNWADPFKTNTDN